jgi:hypothetical protein
MKSMYPIRISVCIPDFGQWSRGSARRHMIAVGEPSCSYKAEMLRALPEAERPVAFLSCDEKRGIQAIVLVSKLLTVVEIIGCGILNKTKQSPAPRRE